MLLTLTVGSISYVLIDQQKRTLHLEMQKTVVQLGRNLAISSKEALSGSDAETELSPLVKMILANTGSITSIAITDTKGVTLGHSKPDLLSKPHAGDITDLAAIKAEFLRADEALYQSGDGFLFRTPVRNENRIVGHVSMGYSKNDLATSVHRALIITLIASALVLSIGMLLSLMFFRRISKPMGSLMRGIKEIGEGRYSTRIDCACKNEFQLLAESFNDMSGKIEAAQDRLVNKHRMDQELEIAREIQAALIPTAVPELDGYQVAVHYKSASQVGGDYLDAIPIDPNNIALVMADVSGKGVPGLVVMAMLKIMVTTLVARRTTPATLIRELNISMRKTLKPNMFVTFFIAYLNGRTGRLVYSNAGHNPLVIFDPMRKRCEFHKMSGPPLGIFAPTQFDLEIEEYEIQMAPGTLILQYTDGLNESMNTKGEQFSLNRILSECKRNAVSGAKTLVPCLIDAERKFRGNSPPADDVAILALSACERVPAEHGTYSRPRD